MTQETACAGKETAKKSKWKEKTKIKWNSLLRITDISPRKTRDWIYVILYTDADVTVCCSEIQAQRLCLNEPYEMRGYLNYKKGGVYLVLDRAKLFSGKAYRDVG